MRPSSTPLLHADEIARRVGELAQQISNDLHGHDVVAICVLKGAVHFASDLVRRLSIPLVLDFIRPASYSGTKSTNRVEMILRPSIELEGRTVLVIEDILDTGQTTAAVLDELRTRGPKQILVATLLDKPARRIVPVRADYVGFEIADRYVVGYGLDFDERFRELPSIHLLERD